MFGLNPYLLGGFAAVLLAALGFAGCEHKNAKAARSARDTAIVERFPACHHRGASQSSKGLAGPAQDSRGSRRHRC
jgi:hypothetical protein